MTLDKISIYHIVHIDRLPSIIQDGCLFSDAVMNQRKDSDSMIGLSDIKQRRLTNRLNSYPDLCVGDCVPFYFCPRSIMLYMIYRRNSSLQYQGGQEPIIHLQANFAKVINWANQNHKRWVFTISNAGSSYFEDFNNIQDLSKIDWQAVQARNWQDCKHGKQAEFLLEEKFPWFLIDTIGVYPQQVYAKVANLLPSLNHQPQVIIQKDWYY